MIQIHFLWRVSIDTARVTFVCGSICLRRTMDINKIFSPRFSSLWWHFISFVLLVIRVFLLWKFTGFGFSSWLHLSMYVNLLAFLLVSLPYLIWQYSLWVCYCQVLKLCCYSVSSFILFVLYEPIVSIFILIFTPVF